jgi:hypothetical protein
MKQNAVWGFLTWLMIAAVEVVHTKYQGLEKTFD